MVLVLFHPEFNALEFFFTDTSHPNSNTVACLDLLILPIGVELRSVSVLWLYPKPEERKCCFLPLLLSTTDQTDHPHWTAIAYKLATASACRFGTQPGWCYHLFPLRGHGLVHLRKIWLLDALPLPLMEFVDSFKKTSKKEINQWNNLERDWMNLLGQRRAVNPGSQHLKKKK